MTDPTIGDPTTFRVPAVKRKASSSVHSLKKSKKIKPNDSLSNASSILSLTRSMAYGAHDNPDDFDLDDDQMSTSEVERNVNIVQIDTSQFSRDNGVLFSEDLTDDYEVWTLQCPDDVDISELNGKVIPFNRGSTLKISNTMSHKIDLIPYRSLDDTNITIVIPSENTKKLSLNVVPLAGTLIISNRVQKEKITNHDLLPVDTIEDATKRRSQLMEKITQRLSNKYNNTTTLEHSLKKEFKMEAESPNKVRKIKRKLTL